MARRKSLTEHVEAFAQRLISRHVAERNWAAVAEDFAWLGRFHEKQDELKGASS